MNYGKSSSAMKANFLSLFENGGSKMKNENFMRDYKEDHGASCHTDRVYNFRKLSLKFLVTLLLPMTMLFSLPASAISYSIPGYHIQLLPPPPGSTERSQTFGFNNKGIVVGVSDAGPGGWKYEMKTGKYTTVDDFSPLAINNNGLMAGASLSGNCAIRDKHGVITEFSTPSLEALGEPCDRSARAVNENGKVTGFEILLDGTWFGYVYDSKKGVTEEYLANSVRTIAQGITSSGAIVGSTAVDGERVAFLRDKDGSVKTFMVNEPDAISGLSNARGISENGKLISGFYTSSPDFESVGFVAESSGIATGPGPVNLDVTVLEIRPCNPESSPPSEWLSFTDTFAQAIRNDGVIVGGCGDYYWEGSVADPDFLNVIFDYNYTFIATPE
jgi:hypothetical protein